MHVRLYYVLASKCYARESILNFVFKLALPGVSIW